MSVKRKTQPQGKKGTKRPAKKTTDRVKPPKDQNGLTNVTLYTVGKSFRAKVKLDNKLTGAKLTRTLSGASNLELTVSDPEGDLLNSGFFDARGDGKLDALKVTIDGLEYRIAALAVNGDSLTLTFEDRAVAQLRKKTGPEAWTRGAHTRAQFIDALVGKLSDPPKRIVPAKTVKRKIAKVKD